MKKDCNELSCRRNRVGGQAVLEGVMMKAGDRTVTTCRKEDGSIVVTDDSFVSVRKKHKLLDLPIIRGVVNFIEMMALSVKTMGASAEAMGLEEEEPGKFEKWLTKTLGMRTTWRKCNPGSSQVRKSGGAGTPARDSVLQPA